ncbi:MAG: MBL fold metallo-hydrolase [Candidatus Eremiobacteraeota bacterium]|nr:MBL fold metallo-hydrolase [Candidatus Eremiobacteraeota bacterium]
MDNLEITVLYDNCPYKKGLKLAWGFSCLVKGLEKTILFDVGGDGKIILENMRSLGINPKDIDVVVLSHDHWDHTGGLNSFLTANSGVAVYMLESFSNEVKSVVKLAGADLIETKHPVKICEHAYLTGEIRSIVNEQSLCVMTPGGQVLIAGCAHPDITLIARFATNQFQKEFLLAMGGFHLKKSSDIEIKSVISELKGMDLKYVSPCHCTGELATTLFGEAFGDKYIESGAGRVINITDLI